MPGVGKTHVTGAFFIIYLLPATGSKSAAYLERMRNARGRINKHFAKILGLTELSMPGAVNNRRSLQVECDEGDYETEFDHRYNRIILRFNLTLRSIAALLKAADTAELARIGELYAGSPVKSVSMGIRTAECLVNNQ